MSHYNAVLEEALRKTVDGLEQGEFRPQNERDLCAYLFRACLESLKGSGHKIPLPVHMEKKIAGKAVDLAIGEAEQLVVELKFEDFRAAEGQGSLFVTEKAAGGPAGHSIEKDVNRLRALAAEGRTGHLLVMEMDDGSPGEWYFPGETGIIGIPKTEWHERQGFCFAHHTERPGVRKDPSRSP